MMTLRRVAEKAEEAVSLLDEILAEKRLDIDIAAARRARAGAEAFLLTLPEFDDRLCQCSDPDCSSKQVKP
jgi:hypothetical protein